MATMWLKEKRLELTGQLEYNGFHISQLYGAHVHQEKVYKVLQLVQSRKICDASRHDKEENEAWNRRYKFRDPGPYRDQFWHERAAFQRSSFGRSRSGGRLLAMT